MSGPDGDHSPGYREWITVDAPHSFEVRDGFAEDNNGTPNTTMPSMSMAFEFTETGAGQIDAVLADLASSTTEHRTVDALRPTGTGGAEVMR